ncbi:MAG: hypothetical protein RLY85_555 [Bacteroidota bacterium]|jgi:hypothetical protein
MINLNNYESWLLLYADGELSPAEEQVVEAFLQQHPMIRTELEMMTALKCEADEKIVFEGKSGLYITEEIPDEEVYVLSPDLQIVFPDKLLLYKKAPVARMFWLKPLSVAASLILMVTLMWQVADKDAPVVPSESAGKMQGFASAGESMELQSNQNKVSQKLPLQVFAGKPKQATIILQAAIKPNQQLTETGNATVPEDDASLIAAAFESAEQTTAGVQNNFSQAALEAARLRLSAPQPIEAATVTPDEPDNNEVNTALLIEAETKEEDRSIFRGLIRRISRTIQDNEDRQGQKFIQVANFQIPIKE